MKVVSVKEMTELDRRTIGEAGIPGKVLMERAGIGAGIETLEFIRGISRHVKRIVLLAGKGNNGGDAYVTAKYLSEHSGYETVVWSICPFSELKDDAKFHYEQLPSGVKCEFRPELYKDDFKRGDIIVDALLGTGFRGDLKSPYTEWIKAVNSSGCPVIAMDIPSGLNGDTGLPGGEAITADLTVTMALPKTGLLINRGPEHSGRIRIVDIGIPQEYIKTESTSNHPTLRAPLLSRRGVLNEPAWIDFFTKNDAVPLVKRLPFCCHKKSRGTVLVIGGSSSYQGAPFLAGKAALRAGAGLVTVAVPESAGIRYPRLLSIITRRIKDSGDGVFSEASIDSLVSLAGQHDAVVIGPGMTASEKCLPVLKDILESGLESGISGNNHPGLRPPLLEKAGSFNAGKNVVVDADALNLLALHPDVLRKNDSFVFTPHPGEAARLFAGFGCRGAEQFERIDQAEKLVSLTGGTVVLKGCRTVVCNDREMPSINGSGSPALATAGSGDVLSGVIAAYLASGLSSFDAARLAAYVHGLAGECGGKGMRGLTADDIADLIPEALKSVSPFA